MDIINIHQVSKKSNGTMVANQRCPKCSGSLFFDNDSQYPEVSCLQCGYARSLNPTAPPLPITQGRQMK
jgi:ribosomal protein S27AE